MERVNKQTRNIFETGSGSSAKKSREDRAKSSPRFGGDCNEHADIDAALKIKRSPRLESTKAGDEPQPNIQVTNTVQKPRNP